MDTPSTELTAEYRSVIFESFLRSLGEIQISADSWHDNEVLYPIINNQD